MSYDESRAMVTHYARLGYARHVQTTCANAARALGNDPALSFWRAFGTIVEGGHSEAITKLEAMLGHADGDIELACITDVLVRAGATVTVASVMPHIQVEAFPEREREGYYRVFVFEVA